MFRRLLIATLIGILAALAVAAFRHAMQLLEWIFLSNDTGSLVNAAEGLSPWRRLITPALGGLAAGLLLWGWQKMNQQRPHAPTDYMEALQTDGQFDVGASLVKSLASLLVVVSGSAIGREGAMILLAALAASSFARRFTPREEWKLWIASGAAAGMAGAYHAPLAGSLFIAEILFGTLMLASLGPVVVSAVVALLTTHVLNGSDSLLYTVHLTVDLHAREYVMIVSTGLVAGLCGPLLLPASQHFRPTSLRPKTLFINFRLHWRDRGLPLLFAEGFLLMGAFVTLFNYIGYRLMLSPWELSQAVVGLLSVAYLTGTWSSPKAGAMTSRYGRGPVMLFSTAVMLGGLLLTLFTSLWLIFAGMLLFSAGFFAAHSVASSWIGPRARRAKGQASSLYLFSYYLGSSIAGTLGGVFWHSYGWNGVGGFIALMLVLAILVGTRLHHRLHA